MSAALSVSIKLLSGDIITLDTPSDISQKTFYRHVHSQLDPAIRPTLVQQLTLLRLSLDKQEQEQVSLTSSDPLCPAMDEIFFLLIDPNLYHVDFDFDCVYDTQIYHEPFRSTYIYYVMRFYRNNEIIHRQPILYNYDDYTFYNMDYIPHQIIHTERNGEEDQDHEDDDEYVNEETVVYMDMDSSLPSHHSIWSISQQCATHTLLLSSNSALLVAYFADAAWTTLRGQSPHALDQ